MNHSILTCARKAGRRLSALGLVVVALASCNSVIYDDEGDCSVTHRVRFRYDRNMKFADAFAHEVEAVTLYAIDAEGRIAWQRTEQGEALAAEGYAMTLDLPAGGDYELLAWAGSGLTDGGESFTVPALQTGDSREQLACTLTRRPDTASGKLIAGPADGGGLKPLFHGHLPQLHLEETEGVYEHVVSLTKNTNQVRVVLQHLSGEAVDASRFTFEITDCNGRMAWDNSLLPDDQLTYPAWRVTSGTAGLGDDTSSAATREVSTVGVAVAELTVARLLKGNSPRLTIRNDRGETVLSIPLIDYALLVKGYYNSGMDDQEFLDRQDEYVMTFFLDERDRWFDAYIYINSWKIVLQDVEI